MKQVVVIGSGIGGIAVAIRLAIRGYNVTIYEKNPNAGGKIAEIREKGFRWDTGPSLFTLPELAYELFELCGENPETYLPYKRIDPICNYFYPDGIRFKAWAEAEKFAAEMETNAGEPAKNTLSFLKKYKELYEIAAPAFLFNSFQKLSNFAKPEFRKTLFKLHKLDSLTTMFKRNSNWFKTPYAAQLFNRYATYNGSNPYQIPATLNMIAHLEHNLGGYFPEKGMFQVSQSLFELAKRQGVTFHFNSPVEQVIYENKKVTGVEVNGNYILADIVISNSDAATFYNKLMPNVKKPPAVTRHELSSSGIIFYWGVNQNFPELELHNILFSGNYKEEFETLFQKKNIYHDPTVYMFISSKLIPEDAPAGSENWFVMINAPANYNQNWESLVQEARKNIIRKIKSHLGIDIEKHLVCEHQATPVTIEQQTASWKGALYGNSSNGMLSAFNRHANFSRTFKNLYFVGGSVHPGGGIPLCLCSAKIVDDLISNP